MKNQKVSYLISGLLVFGLLSCNSEKSTEQSTISESSDSEKIENKIDIPPLSAIPEIKTEEPSNETIQTLVSEGPYTTKSTVSNTSGVRLNPAHGQPGHDCAVAVGAPLKNAVSTAPTPAPVNLSTPISLPTEVKPVAAPAPIASPNVLVNSNAKLNPAHGQPGHDCAVAVGAPLPLK